MICQKIMFSAIFQHRYTLEHYVIYACLCIFTSEIQWCCNSNVQRVYFNLEGPRKIDILYKNSIFSCILAFIVNYRIEFILDIESMKKCVPDVKIHWYTYIIYDSSTYIIWMLELYVMHVFTCILTSWAQCMHYFNTVRYIHSLRPGTCFDMSKNHVFGHIST